ncbi:PilZ domain-containing protein [Paraglaciecola aquimarina]|uniref:PilZ domain-containing protein n=1 Tax=Paraglaciecola algarum TaxID=3050085 RepID=A0ABS9D261_9ALTE|nr:PilZ domain-containing protein [Paraglaciecola sp. G1-23]MCF2946998.1 PilZ domain-containing protein [Paraglaciecola sp. G1-23]
MDNLTLNQKHEQFNEFFMIKHDIPVNLSVLSSDFELPELDDLHNHMPYTFQVASELSEIETKALRPLRNLGQHAVELAEFLNHQSRKIDLMMSLILQQQSEPEEMFHSIQFGGGGITVNTQSNIPVGSLTELKIFLREEASAIFCYAEVIRCELQVISPEAQNSTCKESEDTYHTSLIFTRIREEDQDLLVKASLHLQAASLRKRKNNNQAQNK